MEPNMSENITVTRQSLKALLCDADADTAKAVDAIRALLRAIRDEHPNWKHAAVSAAADYLDARIHDARVDGARP